MNKMRLSINKITSLIMNKLRLNIINKTEKM